MQLGKTGAVAVAAALTVGFLTTSSFGATIEIEPADDPGVGFNDPAVVPPVGGNMETTRGAQALAAFKAAADIWGAALDSVVPITVAARFGPLECSATTGVVGSGTPHSFVKDSNGATPGVWYPIALANRLAGVDLAPAAPDIDAVFNGAAGTPGCLEGSGWYLGLDRNAGNQTDLVTAVVHELAHGLGVTTLVDLDTGAMHEGFPDVFSLSIVDERTGSHWPTLTDSARAQSARAFHQLSWDGSNVSSAATALLLHGMPALALGAPLDTLDPPFALATFGPALTTTPVTGALSAVVDGTAPTGDACEAPASLAGRVALIEAGGCSDVTKVLSVQGAGAVAAILVSDKTTFMPLAPTGDDGGKATIPSIRISQRDAASLRGALAQAPSAKLWVNPARLLGTSVAGRLYLDATDPVQSHVSVTHWDPMISPHLLMQPTLLTTKDLDVTVPLMHDIGWRPYRCGDGIVEGTEECDNGPDAGASPSCTADCKRIGGSSSGSGGTSSVLDASLPDSSIDASRDAVPGNVGSSSDAPPGPNHYIDAGPQVPTSSGGIVWAPRSQGCDCRVGGRGGSGAGAIGGAALGVAVLLRRRRAQRRARV